MSVRRFSRPCSACIAVAGQHEARWRHLLGEMIVGTATLMFVFVLISGIVIWWPRTKKVLKNSLKIVINKGWRRFCYDLHVAGGMYTLIFLQAMALTGSTWSFSWYRTGFYKVFGVETAQGGGGHGAPAQTAAHGGDW